MDIDSFGVGQAVERAGGGPGSVGACAGWGATGRGKGFWIYFGHGIGLICMRIYVA